MERNIGRSVRYIYETLSNNYHENAGINIIKRMVYRGVNYNTSSRELYKVYISLVAN